MFAKLFLPIFSRAFGCKQCKSEVSYVCISFKNRTAANQAIAENLGEEAASNGCKNLFSSSSKVKRKLEDHAQEEGIKRSTGLPLV